MNVETTTSDRIAAGDAIVVDAMDAATDFAEVFVDLTGVRAPLISVGPVGYTPAAQMPPDLPDAPDDARQESAQSALSGVDGEVNNFDQNVIPDVNSALAGFQTEIDAISVKLGVLSNLADNIVIPQASDFMFSEGDYRADNDLDEELKAIIEDEIKKGGEGFDDTAEAAFYERDQARREIARQEAVDDGLDEKAGCGFSMPQGFHLRVVEAVNEKYRMDDRTRSKDIMIAQSKLSLDNKWRAIEAGISYNQIIIAYTDALAQRALEAAVAVFSVGIDAIKYRLNAALKQLDLAKAEIGAIADGRRIDIERYGVEIMRLSKKIDALIAGARAYITAYRTDGQIYASGIGVAARESKFRQSENVLALEAQKAGILADMSAAKNALHSYLATAKIRLGATKAMAQMQKANAQGILESLDTVVQVFKSGETTTSG